MNDYSTPQATGDRVVSAEGTLVFPINFERATCR